MLEILNNLKDAVANFGQALVGAGQSLVSRAMGINKQQVKLERAQKTVQPEKQSIRARTAPEPANEMQWVKSSNTNATLLTTHQDATQSVDNRYQPLSAPKSFEQLRMEKNQQRYAKALAKNPRIPKEFKQIEALAQRNAHYPVTVRNQRKVVPFTPKANSTAHGKHTVPDIDYGKDGCFFDFGDFIAYQPYPSVTRSLSAGARNMDLAELVQRANLRIPHDLTAQVSPRAWSDEIIVTGTDPEMQRNVVDRFKQGPFETVQPGATPEKSWPKQANNDPIVLRRATTPSPLTTTPLPTVPRPTFANKRKDEEQDFAPTSASFEPTPPSPGRS